MDVDASRASQANQVSGAWLFVNVGIPTGSNTPNEAYGVQGNVFMQATGTLALAEGGLFGVAINGGNGSTVITSARDATFKAITKSVGTITNAYGAYFEDQTVAGTENAAIRFQTTGMMSWNNDVWLSRINVGKLYLNGTLTLGALSGVLKASAGLIGGNAVLNDLSDLNAGAPAGGNVLSWDAGTSKWVPIAGGSSVWTDDGTNIYPANLARNVGIGTTSPSMLLTVGNNSQVRINNGDSNGLLQLKAQSPYSDLTFNIIGSAGTSVFNIDGAGNVSCYADQTFGAHNLILGTTQTVRVQPSGLNMASTGNIGWSADTHAYSALDTSISRYGAGVVAVGTGAQGSYAGTLIAGNVGIGTTSPSARLHLAAGVATAFGAPFKLTSGVNLTSPEDGALEYDGSHLYFTIGSTRSALV
jgi:hypothetical protein